MRRLSAQIIIAVPWIVATVLTIVAARASWGWAILAFSVSVIMAAISANYVARTFRAFNAELRATAGRASELGARAQLVGFTEQQLLAIIESITEGILQVSATARFVHVNPAACEMLNLPPNAKGQSAAALIRNSDLRAFIERAATGQSFEPAEITFEDRHLLVSARPFRLDAEASESSGAVIAIVDLTEFRRLESVRRDFVANVSHELKTPLTSIRGYTETLLNDDVPSDLQKQFLAVVDKNAERIQRIVDDLLDLSRLQSGGWRPELQEVDPASLAKDVWASCEDAHKKRIELSVTGDADRDVLADPGGLRQIFSNLFDNAIRYTPEGGKVTVTIAHRAGHNGHRDDELTDFVDVEVKDNGAGIPRESLPRIFERFYRVDPARSRGEGGTGLGLSIVKHLAERMSGEVSAESELGKGTTIRIRLPAASIR